MSHTRPLNHLPGLLQGIQGNPEFDRKDIHRSDRKDAQADPLLAGSHDAVDHLVDRSVAPGGDDRGVSFHHRVAGNLLGISWEAAQADLSSRAKGCKLFGETPRLFTAGGGIEDDQRILHTSQLLQDS